MPSKLLRFKTLKTSMHKALELILALSTMTEQKALQVVRRHSQHTHLPPPHTHTYKLQLG